MPKNEIYDVTFKCPFNCIMSGSSGSGKTTRLLEFLQLKDVICNTKFYKIYYFYSTWQNIYDEMKLQKLEAFKNQMRIQDDQNYFKYTET